jgi:hypothetical protein
MVWAGYLFVKAGVYLSLGFALPLRQAILLRSVIGGVSLGLMVAVSITHGRRLFFLCRRMGLLAAMEAAGGPTPS